LTPALVLHDLGDPEGGAGWRSALDAETWSAPDLPGHGSAPAPRNGAYDPMAVVTLARCWFAAREGGARVVMAVGQNAHAGAVLGAGGGCDALVLVDGLHGPFGSPVEDVAAMYATVRAIADDPAATGPPPTHGLDPRATYGYGVTVTATFLQRFWGDITLPVLVVETPASATPALERAERVSWFAGPVTLAEVPDSSPATIAGAVEPWLATLGR
jgi:hypothetical protein